MIVYFLLLCSLLFSAFNPSAHADDNYQQWVESFLTAPPENLPVTVNIRLNFLHLVSINEHDETFTADIYLHSRWNDPRLSYEAAENSFPKTYIGDSCKYKLNEIWRPDIEFVNSGIPEYTNRSLFIFPDGTVHLNQGITATFRNRFDFRKLPFDQQTLQIIISSFTWDDKIVVFKIDKEGVEFGKKLKDAYEEIEIVGMNATVTEQLGMETSDLNNFSVFTATLHIKRAPSFYNYQVFFPLLVVIGLCSSVLFIPPTEVLGDKIQITLTAVLVFIATKFLLNQDLPKIGYLTFIDKVFFISYVFTAVVSIICILEYHMAKRNDPRTGKFSKIARVLLPVLYLIACGVLALLEAF